MRMLLLAGLYLSEIQNVVYSADEGGRGHFDLRCQKKNEKEKKIVLCSISREDVATLICVAK